MTAIAEARPRTRTMRPVGTGPGGRNLFVGGTSAYVACVTVGVATARGGTTPVEVIAGVVSVVGWLLLCRCVPASRGWAGLGCAAFATAATAVASGGWAGSLAWFSLCLLAAGIVAAGGARIACAYVAGAIVLLTGEWIAASDAWGAWMGGTIASAAFAIAVARQRDLLVQLHEAQADLADRARSEERTRIAREVHDVLAHSLTVSLLHVTSARLAVEHDPADAARSLAEAERLGRQSLDEVRATMGLLRDDLPSDAGPALPQPGLAGVPDLVQRFRSAGADVSLVADAGDVPAITGLAAYRIIQEALTNATKHAPGAPVAVAVSVDVDRVTITVDSAGPPGAGTGHGTVGMRERAEALGGHCSAGPGGDGWQVNAALPFVSAPESRP